MCKIIIAFIVFIIIIMEFYFNFWIKIIKKKRI